MGKNTTYSLLVRSEETGRSLFETIVYGLLAELHEEARVSFVIVTHDEQRARQFENVYRLQDGVLIRDPDIRADKRD